MIIDHAALAASYFQRVNNREADKVAAMFLEDGLIIMPNGTQVRGRPAIRDLYLSLFASDSPMPQLINTVGSRTKMATEMLVHLGDGKLQPAADFFQLTDSGLIIELRIYTATPSTAAIPPTT